MRRLLEREAKNFSNQRFPSSEDVADFIGTELH